MSRAIVILNLGDYWPEKARASVTAAAQRWGADVLEETVASQCHPFWQKAQLWRKALASHERVLQLDGDMLVRSDCPNPFEWVPGGHFGVVSAHQVVDGQHFYAARKRSNEEWAKKQGIQPAPGFRHLNAGFILYDRPLERWLELWQEYGKKHSYIPLRLPEQSCLSNMLWHYRKEVPQTWLPYGFNRVGAQSAVSPSLHHVKSGPMRDWVYHFTGRSANPAWKTKEARMDACWWNVGMKAPGRARAVAARIPEGPASVAEVGVKDGKTSLWLLNERQDIQLLMVDLWREHGDGSSYVESGDKLATLSTWDHWKHLQALVGGLRNHGDRASIVQADSVRGARMADPESQDVVFIDADHSEAGCAADIEAWWPKVKPGGYIGGHDYGVKSPEWDWGVKEAVDAFVAHGGLELERGQDHTWFVRKPTDG